MKAKYGLLLLARARAEHRTRKHSNAASWRSEHDFTTDWCWFDWPKKRRIVCDFMVTSFWSGCGGATESEVRGSVTAGLTLTWDYPLQEENHRVPKLRSLQRLRSTPPAASMPEPISSSDDGSGVCPDAAAWAS